MNPDDLIHVILVTKYWMPCGYQCFHRGNEPSPLAWGKWGYVCPGCGSEHSHQVIKRSQWTEVVE